MWVKTALAPCVMIAVTFLVTSKSTCNHSLGLLLWGRTEWLQPFSSNEKYTFVAAEAKPALHIVLDFTCPTKASGWSCWVLNQATLLPVRRQLAQCTWLYTLPTQPWLGEVASTQPACPCPTCPPGDLLAWATFGLHALVLPCRFRRAWEGDQLEKTLVL